jgi:hypothetical protein
MMMPGSLPRNPAPVAPPQAPPMQHPNPFGAAAPSGGGPMPQGQPDPFAAAPSPISDGSAVAQRWPSPTVPGVVDPRFANQ